MEKIGLTINGKNISCPSGTSILRAAVENGIKIPTLCYHPHLEPAGACRLCLVEDEKSGRILASCVTPVSPDMVIRTDSPDIKNHRTNIIRLMMANHPESCIVCNQGNRCDLRKIAAELGVGAIDLYPMPHYTGLEEANPFIIRDLSKCILCGKCIRADHDLVAVGAIDYNLRGFKSRPVTVHERPLERSSCTFCGTCVSMCPTGALATKNARYVGTPQKESTSICGFCGVGCSLVMGSADNRIVEVNPSHQEGSVNRSTLCVRGHFAHDYLNSTARVTTPMIRKNGELVPASWEEAFGFVIERLKTIRNDNGPQSLGFLGSTKCTVEENYLFQKLARLLFGSNNVDTVSYGSGRPVKTRFYDGLEGSGRRMPLADLEKAELIFVIGADPTQSAPVVGYAVKRAARMKDVPLIVADPRKTSLVPFSSLWLPVDPGRDRALIDGLAAMLYQRTAYDGDFITRFTKGFEAYGDHLSAIDLQLISRSAGLPLEVMERAASLIEGKKMTIVVGHGILQQKHGNLTMDALLNLALMTGSLGGEGRGFYFLSRDNNEAGAWDMGSDPDYLPGCGSIRNVANRKYWEEAWGGALSSDPGLNVVRMIEEAEKGHLKALYIMGENPLRSLPQPERIRSALGNLDFLAVQDILVTETTRMADVVLPGAPFSEKGGSFTNMEGRIQSFDPVTSPQSEARPDWQILATLFQALGYTGHYDSLQGIRDEIRHLVPMYRSVGQNGSACWIDETCGLALSHPDGHGESIAFSPVSSPEEARLDEAYPLKGILGSMRVHLGSGTRTGRSDRIEAFGLKGEAVLSPEDGERLNLREGEVVRISSPHGTITREVTLDKDLKPGLVFIPTAFHDNDATKLIELTRPGEIDSPGWHGCDVKIESTGG